MVTRSTFCTLLVQWPNAFIAMHSTIHAFVAVSELGHRAGQKATINPQSVTSLALYAMPFLVVIKQVAFAALLVALLDLSLNHTESTIAAIERKSDKHH